MDIQDEFHDALDRIETLKEQESSAEDWSRIKRLEDRMETLPIRRLEHPIGTLQARLASTPTERQAEAVEADPATAQQAILDYLQTQIEPVDETAIHDAVQARRATIRRTLRTLVDAGTVKRRGQGRRGDAYRYQISGTQVPDIDGYQKIRIEQKEEVRMYRVSWAC